jgi:phenylalanyl-tRNA synthetase beta chain
MGTGGKVKRDLLKIFDISQDLFVFIFELGKLKQIVRPEAKFRELLKYPKVYRDVAFILEKTVTSGEVIEEIKIASSNLLHQTKLFDIFQSDSLGKDKKSLAFQLEYYDVNRTLTEEEVERDFRKAIKAVEKRFHAQLRGS